MSRPLPDALKTVFNHWPYKNGPTVLSVFKAGLNHHTALIEIDGQQQVLKTLDANALNQVRIQQWAHGLGLAPKVYKVEAEHGFYLMEYLPEQPIGHAPIDLACSLRRLHEAEYDKQIFSQSEFCLLKNCEQYLQNCDHLGGVHQQLLPILNHFNNDPTPSTPCHNDLVKENCIFTSSGWQFIDWEFAQRNNPWFDLAAVSVYFDFDSSTAEQFIQTWGADYDAQLFSAAQIAVLWLDILWFASRQADTCHHAKLRRIDKLAKTLGYRLDLSS